MKLATAFALLLLPTITLADDLPVTEKLAQKAGVPLDTYIGGQVFKITRTSPLPNLFGKADIFGRTVDRGSVELRYQGQTPDGKLVFRLVDIDTRSNETTMNRTQVSVTSGQATANSFGGTTTARGSAYTIKGQEGHNEMLPPNTTEFAVDPEKKRELRFGAVTVKVLEFDDTKDRIGHSVDFSCATAASSLVTLGKYRFASALPPASEEAKQTISKRQYE